MMLRYCLITVIILGFGCDDSAPEQNEAAISNNNPMASEQTDFVAESPNASPERERPVQPSTDEPHTSPETSGDVDNADDSANTFEPNEEEMLVIGASDAEPAAMNANDSDEATEPDEPEAPTANPANEDDSSSSPQRFGGDQSMPPPENPEPIEVDTARRSGADLFAPAAPIEVMPRPRRRMNIDQLSTAMSQISGGIKWTERSGRNEVDLFQQLSSTLGVPDYAQATVEDLEPNTVFQKFLNDAARSVCGKMIAADLERHGALENGNQWETPPVLLIDAVPEQTLAANGEAIRDNLRTLLGRFHGRRVTQDAENELFHWLWLFESTLFVTNETSDAWLAVCVGLFTHPDFYLY